VPYHLHLIALALYGVATALALAPFAGWRTTPRGLLLAVPSAGAAFHVAGLTQLRDRLRDAAGALRERR